MDIVLCSDCFQDPGLPMDAQGFGVALEATCPVCRSDKGKKLDKERVVALAGSSFVWGTMSRCQYGAAPVVQFNEHQKTSIGAPPWLEPDLRRIEMATGRGFFRYRPRLWMVGGVERLKALQDPERREPVVRRIISEFPAATLASGEVFYRVRKSPLRPNDPAEYDSPPVARTGRLDTPDNRVMYGSQDLRDRSHHLAVARGAGYDGLIYPSCFRPVADRRGADRNGLWHISAAHSAGSRVTSASAQSASSESRNNTMSFPSVRWAASEHASDCTPSIMSPSLAIT